MVKILAALGVALTLGTVAWGAVRRTVVVNGDIERIVIPIDVAPHTIICAEYRVRYAKPSLSCVDAGRVQAFILRNAAPDCH